MTRVSSSDDGLPARAGAAETSGGDGDGGATRAFFALAARYPHASAAATLARRPETAGSRLSARVRGGMPTPSYVPQGNRILAQL